MRSTRITRVAGVSALVAAPLALLLYVASQRPEPFSTSQDNTFYFGPLIAAQSDAWLSGERPKVVWGLGAGWAPWQSGQTGVLWPLYPIAAAVERATQSLLDTGLLKIGLLDISALLSMWACALVAWLLLPRSIAGRWRVAVSCALSLAPGPLMIGLSWHNYLAPAPASLAVALFAVRIALDGATPRARLGLIAACALFFAGAHVQMYAIGVVFIGLFAIGVATDHRARVRACAWLAVAQAPLVAPLFFFRELAAHMAPGWLRSHESEDLLTKTAVPVVDALVGTLVGDLGGEALGRGTFFNPLFVALVALVVVQRRTWFVPFLFVCAALVVPALVPRIDDLAIGPFDGFRWPRKVMVYVTPLTLLGVAVLIAHPPPASAQSAVSVARLTRATRWLRAAPAWAALAALQLVVFCDASPQSSLPQGAPVGSRGLADRARACAAQLAIAPGTRIAIAGKLKGGPRAPPLPLPFLGMANNAALVVGLESSHLYEPLEQAEVAAQHGSLSAYWRSSVDPARLRGAALVDETRALVSFGTQVLIATRREDLGDLAAATAGTTVGVCDIDGERVYAAHLAGAPASAPSFPSYAIADSDARAPFDRSPGGALITRRSLDVAPVVRGPVPMTWRRLDDGRWRGDPHSPPTWVVVGSALGFAFACACVLAQTLARRRARHESSARREETAS